MDEVSVKFGERLRAGQESVKTSSDDKCLTESKTANTKCQKRGWASLGFSRRKNKRVTCLVRVRVTTNDQDHLTTEGGGERRSST